MMFVPFLVQNWMPSSPNRFSIPDSVRSRVIRGQGRTVSCRETARVVALLVQKVPSSKVREAVGSQWDILALSV